MSRARFVVVPVVSLVIIGLLIAGGWAVHRIGWSQGYAMGQLAAEGEAASSLAYGPSGAGYVGLFLLLAFVLLLVVGIVGKLLRFLAWSAVAGSDGAEWARRWHRVHHPIGPWSRQWEGRAHTSNWHPEPGAQQDGGEATQ